MTNEEMQNIIEFMIQRQEVFSANLERLEAYQERLQANQERTQAQLDGLATIVEAIGEAQLRTEEAVRQTQNDLSHLSKIVTGVVELVTKDRNGTT
jgi:hypothetical protein